VEAPGVEAPGARFAGRPVAPMTGRDLRPLLSGEAERVYGPDDAVGYELAGQAVLFQGDYKGTINWCSCGPILAITNGTFSIS
jgi:arylsulfatase/uncharacterized sulfatase